MRLSCTVYEILSLIFQTLKRSRDSDHAPFRDNYLSCVCWDLRRAVKPIKTIHVSVELRCIYKDLNFGLASMETQCILHHFRHITTFTLYVTRCDIEKSFDAWMLKLQAISALSECRHRRPERSSPTGTAVRGRSDTGELSLPAWKTPGRGRRASEVRHAVSDPGRGQTSKCRWRHAQNRSTHAVTCALCNMQ